LTSIFVFYAIMNYVTQELVFIDFVDDRYIKKHQIVLTH